MKQKNIIFCIIFVFEFLFFKVFCDSTHQYHNWKEVKSEIDARTQIYPTLVPNFTKEPDPSDVHRNPQGFDLDSMEPFESKDITDMDSLIIYDKSKMNRTFKNPDYDDKIPRFDISQVEKNDSIETSQHDLTKQAWFDPENKQSEQPVDGGAILDNFDPNYQRYNRTWFEEVDNSSEIEDKEHPYPPLPKSLQDDPSSTQFIQESETGETVYSTITPFLQEKNDQKIISSNDEENENLNDSDFEKNQENNNSEFFGAENFTKTLETTTKNLEFQSTVSDLENSFQISQSTSPSNNLQIQQKYSPRSSEGSKSKDEEIDYSQFDTVTKETYSTISEAETPFKVTKNLMDSIDSIPIQDSVATIHPTLYQPLEITKNSDEMEMTSDYVSNLDSEQRETMFPRDFLKPWERKRGEKIPPKIPPKKSIISTEIENSSDDNHEAVIEHPRWTIQSKKNNLKEEHGPVSSIYGAQPPPLTSFVAIPFGQQYYGDQTIEHEIEQIKKINNERVYGSDYQNQPQFKLYAFKTATHRAHGVSTKKPKTEKFIHWLANPASIFNLPLPAVLKTAYAVNVEALNIKSKALSDKSKLKKPKFELDTTKNQLKYRKISDSENNNPDQIQFETDLEVISGGTTEKDNVEIESYVDEEEISKANLNICGLGDLQVLSKEFDNKNFNLSQCLVVAENCLLSNAAPIERRINLDLSECVKFCSKHSDCKSISYSSAMSICDIFTFKNGTNQAKLIKYQGYNYFQPTRRNLTKCLEDQKLSGTSIHSVDEPIVINSDDELTTSENNLLDTFISKVNPNAKAKSCPLKSDILLFKADGYRLRNFGIDYFQQNCSESECIFSCLIDLANGTIPYKCVSSSYNVPTNECFLYSAGGNIRGNGHLLESPNFAHYEKVCADVDLVEQCRGFPIERMPQKVLLGFSIQATKAKSLLECVTYCFQRFKTKNDCLAVNYYYTESEQNCVLHSESHITAPLYFIDEIELVTDYSSIDKCLDIKKTEKESQELTDSLPISALAVDKEDGSRVLTSNPGFNQQTTIISEVDYGTNHNQISSSDEFVITNDEDYETTVSHSEIRRAPQKFSTTASTTLPTTKSPMNRLKTKLRQSIRKIPKT